MKSLKKCFGLAGGRKSGLSFALCSNKMCGILEYIVHILCVLKICICEPKTALKICNFVLKTVLKICNSILKSVLKICMIWLC